MDCTATSALLDDYVDGLLGSQAYCEVEAHLVACPACRDEVAQLKAITDLLAAHAEPEYAPDFTAVVLARTTQSAWTLSWLWPAGAAALLSALVVWAAAGLRPAAPAVLAWAGAAAGGLAHGALNMLTAAAGAAPPVIAAVAPALTMACGLCLVLAACVGLFGRRVWATAQAARVLMV